MVLAGDTAYARDIEAGRFVQSMEGQAITVGDIVRTRENNRELGVLNGKSYVVRGVTEGFVRVQSTDKDGSVHTLPVEYVASSVQLGYATTVHSSQGMTVDSAHLLVTSHTDAAGVYVGLTRGWFENVVHCVAADVDEAREQFVEALGRERADGGLGAVAEGLRQMLADTDLATAVPEDYPAWAYVRELEAGDGLMDNNRKYLVAGVTDQGKIYAVPAEPGKIVKPKIFTSRGEIVETVPGGKLPQHPKLTSFITKNRALLAEAQRLTQFTSKTKEWVAHIEANEGTASQFVQARQALTEAQGGTEQARQTLEAVQADFSGAMREHQQRLQQAESRYEQVVQERAEGGFFKRLMGSNAPVVEAERALEQVRGQVPSDEAVVRAQAQVEACERSQRQAQARFEQVSAFFGPAPVHPDWPSASINAFGDAVDPVYEDIEGQARAMLERAVENLRLVDGANERYWASDVHRIGGKSAAGSDSYQEPVPRPESIPGFEPGVNYGPSL